MDTQRSLQSIRNTIVAMAFVMAAVATAGSASALDTVRFGNSSNTLNASPLLLADVAPEIFAKHNIKLEITDFRGSAPNCVASVIGGSVDMCMVANSTANDAIAEGANLKLIVETTRPMSELFLSEKIVQSTGVSPKAPVEDRLRALKGLRISTTGPGTPHTIYLTEMLKTVGSSMADLKYNILTDPIAMMEGIRHGQIDGAMWSVGALGDLLQDKAGVRWISLTQGDSKQLIETPFVGVYAPTGWIEKNADVAARLQRGFIDAIARMHADPARSSELIKAKFFPALDRAIWDDAYQQILPAFFGQANVTRSAWNELLKLQEGYTHKNYDLVQFDKVVMPQAQSSAP
jgi:NitT/TauT family transport system substrate-binding protein